MHARTHWAHACTHQAHACMHQAHARLLAPGPHACLVSMHAPGPHARSLAGSPCPLTRGVPTQARTGPCMHTRTGPCTFAHTGPPRPLSLHARMHQAHARALALGPHTRSLAGSPCTCICVHWMHHVCIPQLCIGRVVCSSSVVVACALSEHRSRAPVESCGVVYCTPQALSLFLESCGSCVTLHRLCHCFLSHGTLCCVFHCVCVISSLSIVLLCIYTAVDWELSPQSHSLHCRLVASLFCP